MERIDQLLQGVATVFDSGSICLSCFFGPNAPKWSKHGYHRTVSIKTAKRVCLKSIPKKTILILCFHNFLKGVCWYSDVRDMLVRKTNKIGLQIDVSERDFNQIPPPPKASTERSHSGQGFQKFSNLEKSPRNNKMASWLDNFAKVQSDSIWWLSPGISSRCER